MADHPNLRRHQVAEIPLVMSTVNEHRLHALACGAFDKATRAPMPANGEVVAYRPLLTSIVGYRAIQFRVSTRKTATAMSDSFGVQMAHCSVA